jgi:hypothetical protein
LIFKISICVGAGHKKDPGRSGHTTTEARSPDRPVEEVGPTYDNGLDGLFRRAATILARGSLWTARRHLLTLAGLRFLIA